MLKDEQPTVNGDGKQSIDFTYIENVIEVNLKACKASSEITGEVFNIAYDGREYLIDIYHELCKALDKDSDLYLDLKGGDIKHSNADISKAKRLLRFNEVGVLKKILRN